VAFRTALSNEMSVIYGPHWYTQPSLFRNTSAHQGSLRKIKKLCEQTDQSEIKLYQRHYHTPVEPPSWLIIEALPFGSCSVLYNNIKTVKDRRRVSDVFALHPTTLDSWIQALSYLRNLCAHHARVWNRWLVKIPHHLDRHATLHQTAENERLLYPHLAVIALLLVKISPQSLWKDRLFALFEEYSAVPIHWIGFQNEWVEDSFWELPS
jgi:abortive infection bacteriophage resistance protein